RRDRLARAPVLRGGRPVQDLRGEELPVDAPRGVGARGRRGREQGRGVRLHRPQGGNPVQGCLGLGAGRRRGRRVARFARHDGDDKKARFEKLGLTWTLPAREGVRNFAFSNKMPPDVTIKEKTIYRAATAALDGEGPAVDIQLEIRLANPGATSKEYINNNDN